MTFYILSASHLCVAYIYPSEFVSNYKVWRTFEHLREKTCCAECLCIVSARRADLVMSLYLLFWMELIFSSGTTPYWGALLAGRSLLSAGVTGMSVLVTFVLRGELTHTPFWSNNDDTS